MSPQKRKIAPAKAAPTQKPAAPASLLEKILKTMPARQQAAAAALEQLAAPGKAGTGPALFAPAARPQFTAPALMPLKLTAAQRQALADNKVAKIRVMPSEKKGGAPVFRFFDGRNQEISKVRLPSGTAGAGIVPAAGGGEYAPRLEIAPAPVTLRSPITRGQGKALYVRTQQQGSLPKAAEQPTVAAQADTMAPNRAHKSHHRPRANATNGDAPVATTPEADTAAPAPAPNAAALMSDSDKLLGIIQNSATADDPLSQGSALHKLDDVAWQDFYYYQYFCDRIWDEQAIDSGIDAAAVKRLNDSSGSPYSDPTFAGDPFFADFRSKVLAPAYSAQFDHWLNPTPAGDPARTLFPQLFYDAHCAGIAKSGLWSRLYVMYYALPVGSRASWLSTLTVPRPAQLSLDYKVIFKNSTLHETADAFEVLATLYHMRYQENLTTSPTFEQELSIVINDLAARWSVALAQIERAWESRNGEDVLALAGQAGAQASYPFDFLKANQANIGLRLVYRQEWRPLGMQRGEIVKTIPLGPKQSQKVSTKITRRTKATRSQEMTKESETTTESSDTTKDSTDVVREASSTFKWKLEAEAGYGGSMTPWSAKISGGVSKDQQESSKSTSDHLTETMTKTASKIRNQSKIVVSTETESTFEQTTATEIQNPNEELAVTYIYSKLQRQYQIFTSLAEVDGVVFVAEEVPEAYEVGPDWVRKHDWILSRALLDESHRPALEAIVNDVAPMQLGDAVQQKIEQAMDQASDGIKALASTTNVNLMDVDVVHEAQRAFREVKKEDLQIQLASAAYEQKQERFFNHIRENILHYCRAIWSAEDPDQRVLRYRRSKISVPRTWEFFPDHGLVVDPADITAGVTGKFKAVPDPAVDPTNSILIYDIIDPTGPIGYAGNYAVYRLKPNTDGSPTDPNAKKDIYALMSAAQGLFIETDPDTGVPILVDPAMRMVESVPVRQEFSEDLRELMTDTVPELRGLMQAALADGTAKDGVGWCKAQDPSLFAKHYHHFLFRQQNSSTFLMDTNNLVVDIERGKGTALEQFKLLHRAIDVEKAAWEAANLGLENQRRQSLIGEKKYGDPKVDKLIAVAGTKNFDLNVDTGN